MLRLTNRNLEQTQLIMQQLKTVCEPQITFSQDISRTLTPEGIPVLAIDCFVEYRDLYMRENYLTVLTPALDFEFHGRREYCLSEAAREKIQSGADFAITQLKQGYVIGHQLAHYSIFKDYDPVELQIQWVEAQAKIRLRRDGFRKIQLMERKYPILFKNKREWLDLQLELRERGHDMNPFRDICLNFAEVIESSNQSWAWSHLQVLIYMLPDALRGIPSKERGPCLDLIYLAITYLQECLTNPETKDISKILRALFEFSLKDLHLSHRALSDHRIFTTFGEAGFHLLDQPRARFEQEKSHSKRNALGEQV